MIPRFHELTPFMQRAVAVLGPAVIVAAGWRVVLMPARAERDALERELASEHEALAASQSNRRILAVVSAEVERLETLEERLAAGMRPDADIGSVFEALTELARLEGVELSEFRPRDRQDDGGNRGETADISLAGPFHDVVRFLDSVAATLPFVTVLDVRVVPATGRAARPGAVRLSARAVSHTFEPPLSAGDEAAAGELGSPDLPPPYDDEGRRDPFVNLMGPAPAGPSGGSPAAAPAERLGAVALADVTVRGIVRNGSERLAILETTARRSFVIRTADRLLDASVAAIDAAGVVFVQDPARGESAHVRKPLHAGSERLP